MLCNQCLFTLPGVLSNVEFTFCTECENRVKVSYYEDFKKMWYATATFLFSLFWHNIRLRVFFLQLFDVLNQILPHCMFDVLNLNMILNILNIFLKLSQISSLLNKKVAKCCLICLQPVNAVVFNYGFTFK